MGAGAFSFREGTSKPQWTACASIHISFSLAKCYFAPNPRTLGRSLIHEISLRLITWLSGHESYVDSGSNLRPQARHKHSSRHHRQPTPANHCKTNAQQPRCLLTSILEIFFAAQLGRALRNTEARRKQSCV